MKKYPILLFIALILIPTVLAEIVIDTSLNDKYNFGDAINLEGHISQDYTGPALFYFNLNCDNPVRLLSKTLNLESNIDHIFSENLHIPLVNEGTCFITSELYTQGSIADTTNSNNFILTKELNGNFEILKDLIQLGDNIEISGTVTKLNGLGVDGLATLFFKQNNTNLFVDGVNINKGEFYYKYIASAIPAEKYSINIEVSDAYGNRHLFTNIGEIEITDEVFIDATTDQVFYKPGEFVTISGLVDSLLPSGITGAVVMDLDGQEYVGSVTDGEFSKSIQLTKTLKSGLHNLLIKVFDNIGNHGENIISLNINPLAQSIKIITDNDYYDIDKEAKISISIIDQAGDEILESANLKIYNPRGEKVKDQMVKTSEAFIYKFTNLDLPGTWKITSHFGELIDEINVEISETMDLFISLENNTLGIRNIGNVDYNKPVTISLRGPETVNVAKRGILRPDEISYVDLTKEVSKGTYDIIVRYDDQEKKFPGITIYGRNKLVLSKWIYIVLGLIILALLATQYKKLRKHDKREKEFGEFRREELQKLKEEKEAKNKRPRLRLN